MNDARACVSASLKCDVRARVEFDLILVFDCRIQTLARPHLLEL